jgi:MFS family permease
MTSGAQAGVQRYRSLVALPGARVPLVASALGSLAIGMFTLAILLLVREATGSFADAGRVVGAFGAANAVGAVAQGRLMDRLGQPRVLRAAGLGHALAMAAFVVAAERGAAMWLLFVCAVAGGACVPQLPAGMRSLWSVLVDDEERRQAAYALVSIVFEVSVVAAPALVAAIATASSPAVAVAAGAVAASGGALTFAATRASGSWGGARHEVGWLGPLTAPGMRTVFLALAALGAAIGVVQVAVPAFTAADEGSAEAGGLLLAALSAGSLVGGFVYGARSWPGAPAARLAALLAGLGGGCALLALAGAPAAVAVCLVAIGLLLAPTTIVGSALLDVVAPAGTVTEAFTVMIMGVVAGTAAGNAVGGAIVEGASYEAAALTAAAAAVLGAAFVVARRRTLAPATSTAAG